MCICTVLIVLGRLRLVNCTAIQISIQSTKDATYRCRLNNGKYFSCKHFRIVLLLWYMYILGNDGDSIAWLLPNTYTVMVEATSNDDPPQFASDIAGPVILTGSVVCKCNTKH